VAGKRGTPVKYMTVVPAYGRDYPSKAKAVADWEAGLDFRIQDIGMGSADGRYVSVRDIPQISEAAGQPVTVNIRYKRLTMVAVVEPAE
jgi:hypothetical protein